jgi:hypothetical protein
MVGPLSFPCATSACEKENSVKKALLVAAFAATLCGPTLFTTAPAAATEIIAQSSMTVDPMLKSAMDKLHDSMSSMTPSGDTDKDASAFMKMLGTAMKATLQTEMQHGKDPKMKAAAKSEYEKLYGSGTPFFGGFGV